MSTLAGKSPAASGFADGRGSSASFSSPTGIVSTANGQIAVADAVSVAPSLLVGARSKEEGTRVG